MDFKKIGLRLAGTIFGFVALLHLLRLITKIHVDIGGWLMPAWLNYFGFVGATVLCIFLWKVSSKK